MPILVKITISVADILADPIIGTVLFKGQTADQLICLLKAHQCHLYCLDMNQKKILDSLKSCNC